MNIEELTLPELFAMECDTQCGTLMDGLVALEKEGPSPTQLEALMRAAHSLKGAARIVNFNQAVRITHAMEDLFVEAQEGKRVLSRADIDRLLAATDLLTQIGTSGSGQDQEFESAADQCLLALRQRAGDPATPQPEAAVAPETPPSKPEAAAVTEATPSKPDEPGETRRMLRVSAENLNHLLGSAAESLVASRHLHGLTNRLWSAHRHQRQIAQGVEAALAECPRESACAEKLRQVQALVEEGDRLLLNDITKADQFEQRSTHLAQRLYAQALRCRMRPFAELAGGLRRAARDAARHVGHEVNVEIIGEGTDVDRDLLEKLESPLGHLIRNAIEHGMEPPDERKAAGKPPKGHLRIEASHTAGFLVIRIADDGRGIDLEKLKHKIIEGDLADKESVLKMERAELLEFLFLPGFSLKSSVSELSGRGVGLDIVRTLAAESRGAVRVSTEEGLGTVFSLQFPVSLSVIRVMLFELAGEAYAIPLARAERATHCAAEEIESTEGRQFFLHNGERIGLIDGAEVLGKPGSHTEHDEVYVLILGDESRRFGVAVSRFLGEGEIVIQPLDPRLGKVRNIAAAALTEDGEPVLLIDTDDFLLSVERLSREGEKQIVVAKRGHLAAEQRHILVVEDSLTVRELERKLITSLGYAVETAVDGADGWNAARSGKFAAVITDIDMPRMDGFELTRLIKSDPRLRDTPVIIVSYKDREEDRRRGLDAGADYYLTKGSFQHEGLARALADVLGEPEGS